MSETTEPLDLTMDEVKDVRPVVATGAASNWSLYAFIGVLAIGGLILFSALNASRQAGDGLAQGQGAGDEARISSPEPLDTGNGFGAGAFIPPESRGLGRETFSPASSLPFEAPQDLPPVRVTRTAPEPADFPPPPRYSQASAPVPQFLPAPPMPQPPAPEPAREPARAQVVYENRTAPDDTEALLDALDKGTRAPRVKASRLENPTMTIPQGTVIAAVLETAIDSNRGGGVRALVQRNVRGFDGKQILIPRGSRLYGEYKSDLRRGQNRALVQWTRLIRPDGVTIALDSPSSDPLGRAGVKGKVDSKFFQRFGNALLQSVLDVGVGLAVNSATDGVILALPGSTQNVQVSNENDIVPTLKVKHGTSVSVFVARDLDFSSVD